MKTELLLTIIVVMWLVNGVSNVLAGMLEMERPTEYGKGHIISGMITIVFACYFLFGE